MFDGRVTRAAGGPRNNSNGDRYCNFRDGFRSSSAAGFQIASVSCRANRCAARRSDGAAGRKPGSGPSTFVQHFLLHGMMLLNDPMMRLWLDRPTNSTGESCARNKADK